MTQSEYPLRQAMCTGRRPPDPRLQIEGGREQGERGKRGEGERRGGREINKWRGEGERGGGIGRGRETQYQRKNKEETKKRREFEHK